MTSPASTEPQPMGEPMYLISESKIKEIKELIQTISVTGSSVDLDGLDVWFEREILARGPVAQQEPTCLWSEDDEGNWHTYCGQIHQFINGAPEENHYLYCPYCGKPLRSNEVKKP